MSANMAGLITWVRSVPRAARRVWRWAAGLHRSALVANSAVGISLAVLTAVSALVIEDLVPGPRVSIQEGGWSTWRVALLGAALVLFVLALAWRRWVHRTTGTLFYVRMLDETFGDRHEEAVTAARSRRMEMQAVSRWADLRPGPDGVIDVADACDELVVHLETAFNSDRHDTATAVAPNMPWPVALAVGRALNGFVDVTLVELPETTRVRRSAHQSIREERWPSSPTEGGSRMGVVAWFTASPSEDDRASLTDELATCAVGSAWLLTLDRPVDANDPARVDELVALAEQLASWLARIRAENDRELVIYARLPKVTALATGKHLATKRVRFFDRTHLMNHAFINGRDCYQPMRVHASQPTAAPSDPQRSLGT